MTGHETCAQCNFDGSLFSDVELLAAIRALGSQWQELLDRATGDELRERPDPETWSAIEYAAHSRDITALHEYGVSQALSQDEPVFGPIGDDVIESGVGDYERADPADVSTALGTHAAALAQLAETAGTGAWTRGLTVGDDRSDVRRLLEHALHDSSHHLVDVERGLRRLRQ